MSIFAKIKPYEKTPKKASQWRSMQYFDRENKKVKDLKIVFHNERMNVWNRLLKSRKYRDTPSPEKQERTKDQDDIKGKHIQRCSIRVNNE